MYAPPLALKMASHVRDELTFNPQGGRLGDGVKKTLLNMARLVTVNVYRMKPGSTALLTNATRGTGNGGPHCACIVAETAKPVSATRTRKRFIAHLQVLVKARIISVLPPQ